MQTQIGIHIEHMAKYFWAGCEYTGLILTGFVRSYYLDLEGNEITKNFHKEYSLITDEGLLGYMESICAYVLFRGKFSWSS